MIPNLLKEVGHEEKGRNGFHSLPACVIPWSKKITKSNKKQSTAREVISSIPNGYHSILTQTISKIKAAQTRAMVAVNRELVDLYLDIGKTISEQQEAAEWGDSIVEQFAKDLQSSFPGMVAFHLVTFGI
jgi:hypothetical protein